MRLRVRLTVKVGWGSSRVRVGWVRVGTRVRTRVGAKATARVRRLVQQQPARARLIMLEELTCGLVPAEPTAVGSTALEAASSSNWGGGWAPSAPVSPPGSIEPPRADPPSRCAQRRRRSRSRARPEGAFDIAGAHCNVHVVQPALAVAHLAVAVTCDAASRRRLSSTGRVAAACWVCSSPRLSAAALITRCGT